VSHCYGKRGGKERLLIASILIASFYSMATLLYKHGVLTLTGVMLHRGGLGKWTAVVFGISQDGRRPDNLHGALVICLLESASRQTISCRLLVCSCVAEGQTVGLCSIVHVKGA
jgi:hypothetical protein